MHLYQTWRHWVHNSQLYNITKRNHYQSHFFKGMGKFVDFNRGILSMSKFQRITNKLNVAQKDFMLRLWMVRQSLHIVEIHKHNNWFLIVPTMSPKWCVCSKFCKFSEPAEGKCFRGSCTWNRSLRKENSFETLIDEIYRSVFFFISTNHIAENRQIDAKLEYYKTTFLFNLRRLSF